MGGLIKMSILHLPFEICEVQETHSIYCLGGCMDCAGGTPRYQNEPGFVDGDKNMHIPAPQVSYILSCLFGDRVKFTVLLSLLRADLTPFPDDSSDEVVLV